MGKQREQHKIIVVGLPAGCTSTELTKLVRPIGNPLSANIAVDAEGKERGFGFVQFADADTQRRAIVELDQRQLDGRTLNVRAVEERAPGGGAGGARASGGGGSRGGRPCYDFAKGKCTRGAACKWAHVAPPASDDPDGVRSRRPDWQKTRPDGRAGGVGALLEDIPREYCRRYQLGSCHRGAACRWVHTIWRGGEEGGAGAEVDAEAEANGKSRGAAASGTKRQRVGDEAAGGARKEVGSAQVPIGGAGVRRDGEAVQTAEEVRERLAEKERAWREAHPGAAAVPEEAKRRDVVWRALERKLARLDE